MDSTLTIQLFFFASAIAVALEAYKERERNIARAVLWTVVALFAISGFAWPSISEGWPRATSALLELSTSPVAWFVVGVAIYFIARPFWASPAKQAPLDTPSELGDGIRPLTARIDEMQQRLDALSSTTSPASGGDLPDSAQTRNQNSDKIQTVVLLYMLYKDVFEWSDREYDGFFALGERLIAEYMTGQFTGNWDQECQEYFGGFQKFVDLCDPIPELKIDLTKIETEKRVHHARVESDLSNPIRNHAAAKIMAIQDHMRQWPVHLSGWRGIARTRLVAVKRVPPYWIDPYGIDPTDPEIQPPPKGNGQRRTA